MRTLIARHAFSAYPDGKTEEKFAAGDEIIASDEFAELLLAKGHADEPGEKLKGKVAGKDARANKGDA